MSCTQKVPAWDGASEKRRWPTRFNGVPSLSIASTDSAPRQSTTAAAEQRRRTPTMVAPRSRTVPITGVGGMCATAPAGVIRAIRPRAGSENHTLP